MEESPPELRTYFKERGGILQIHVVKSGDTLWQISKTYGVPLNTIIESNEIPNPDNLVIGQTIVVPTKGQYHIIRPGETLYQISKLYNVTVGDIVNANGIKNPNQIPVGLRIYIPRKPRPTVDVLSYVDLNITGKNTVAEINKVGEHLTYLSIFSYIVNRDGTLKPLNDQQAINAAYENRIVPLMAITNIEGGTFNKELATHILSNEELQDKLLAEVIRIMKQKGYLGLDVDFEYVGRENREKYKQFLRKASNILKQNNYTLSVALAPKLSDAQTGTLYEGHDYKGIGEIADFVLLMTYEWGWSGGAPMAVSPIDQVRKVVEYALTVIPSNKVMMGIPLYGYDWTLPYVKGGQWARTLSPRRALQLATQYNATIKYDTKSEAPYFNYVDGNKKEHVVWFEDARSIQAKFNLVKDLKLRGFFYWVLGRDFPQNWLLVEENFNVRKRVKS
ncbi:spore germination protein [Desulfonispora thiosulfatigenes DSM 11270]|uniref:Spore germination protein n=1 Tax=Desulfonispora thiosulfatigenes DSM 11270 TaxID=656914 RepID=A0A1W1UJ07_DESTI|nr:glycoside hydrolase family 18 protein [Desulfonispora thiosulfatigenes]SMB81098.1 spore germination protein [Desulfonispora thiosulfatigenes DSM 11270]